MDRVAASQVRRRVLVAASAVVVGLLAVSSLNPVLAVGASNRLESECATGMEWTYHRDSWTPLRWSCSITRPDGTVTTISAWRLIRQDLAAD